MRQWLVDPRMLCNKHLLGEHLEHHMMIGSIIKKRSIAGFIEKGLIDPQTIYKRHNQLIKEMKSRGMNHQSPLPVVALPKVKGRVNIDANILDLQNRCTSCRKLIKEIQI